MSNPYHPGEIVAQELAGQRSQAILNGRVISNVVPAPARTFIPRQSCLAIGWRDASGDPWSSLLVGDPGFMTCDEQGRTLTISSSEATSPLGSAHHGIGTNDRVGMLVIDITTRRRLRVNGIVASAARGELRVVVEEAYPNCPKYIQRRERLAVPSAAPLLATDTGAGTPPDLQTWLARTDTVFVTSIGPDGRLDCSHRGGRRGFVRAEREAVRLPDYAGNSMFCTLGNMTVEPRAGLVLVDFEARRQLHVSGDAQVHITTTDRWWTLTPRRWAITSLAGSTPWRLIDESPFNPEIDR